VGAVPGALAEFKMLRGIDAWEYEPDLYFAFCEVSSISFCVMSGMIVAVAALKGGGELQFFVSSPEDKKLLRDSFELYQEKEK
jgi:hypothetical protein